MFNTAFLAVLNSPMNDDPVGSEKILQDFYNGANRQKKEVNEATTFVLIFDVLVTFLLFVLFRILKQWYQVRHRSCHNTRRNLIAKRRIT